MEKIVISGTGVFTPNESITNKELVEAYNAYAENFNLENETLLTPKLGVKISYEKDKSKIKNVILWFIKTIKKKYLS